MKVDKIYLRSNTTFSKKVSGWLSKKGIDSSCLEEDKKKDHYELDGLVIFNENQFLPKEIEELRTPLIRVKNQFIK